MDYTKYMTIALGIHIVVSLLVSILYYSGKGLSKNILLGILWTASLFICIMAFLSENYRFKLIMLHVVISLLMCIILAAKSKKVDAVLFGISLLVCIIVAVLYSRGLFSKSPSKPTQKNASIKLRRDPV